MIVALTGHRPNKLGGYGRVNPVRDRIKEALSVWFRERGVTRFSQSLVYSGMAQGFDQWGAEVCIANGVPFVAVIPFEGQERAWPEPAQRWYRQLLAKAERVEIVSRLVSSAAFQVRNEWMVDRCTQVLACFDGSPGGTRNCLDYAAAKKRPIENLWKPELMLAE